MESLSVAILFSSLGPYHIARIEALNKCVRELRHTLIVFRYSKYSDVYSWKPEDESSASIITLLDSPCRNLIDSLLVALRLYNNLRKYKISAILLPSFSPSVNLFCLIAAKLAGCKTILMTESWHSTESTFLPIQVIKRILFRMFDAALVGGVPHMHYVISYGMSPSKVFSGYDVVDVDYFAKASVSFKGIHTYANISLPSRYFLSLGRFVEKKNISSLLSAYALYLDHASTTLPSFAIRNDDCSSELCVPLSLVLVGDGPLHDQLVSQAIKLGLSVRDADIHPRPLPCPEVVIYPFQQYSITPFFFSNCDAFILPSFREEWGLVVNEAQACGVPVLVSSCAGCSADLVKTGVNGFLFDPFDTYTLSQLMYEISISPLLRNRMSFEAHLTSLGWTPSRFAQGALSALKSCSAL